jgi:hypothetical protein
MTDKREAILARLVAIAGTIQGVVTAARNQPDVDDEARPAIVILDADEAADDADPASTMRGSAARRRVGMTPEIYILLGANPENVGTAINAMRAKVIKAILTDATLNTILGTNGAIRYEGCATGLSRGRSLEGEMGVSFTFSYILNPADL